MRPQELETAMESRLSKLDDAYDILIGGVESHGAVTVVLEDQDDEIGALP